MGLCGKPGFGLLESCIMQSDAFDATICKRGLAEEEQSLTIMTSQAEEGARGSVVQEQSR